jgi:TrmH family RNA methyltransferase
MVSKNQIKLINSLHQKKYRIEHGLFLAEGVKVIQELLQSNFKLKQLYCLDKVTFNGYENQSTVITEAEMKKISALSTPSTCLGIFEIINPKPIKEKGIVVALDDIRDPGNFGTIIRLCDWFGVEEIVCSNETVDVYNPKVIQSTMGSITRVNINYCDLKSFLKKAKLPVFGTFMDGQNIYKSHLPQEAIIILGNEANGISKEIEFLAKNKLSIPRFGNIQKTESLNVATATAIILSEFRRND